MNESWLTTNHGDRAVPPLIKLDAAIPATELTTPSTARAVGTPVHPSRLTVPASRYQQMPTDCASAQQRRREGPPTSQSGTRWRERLEQGR